MSGSCPQSAGSRSAGSWRHSPPSSPLAAASASSCSGTLLGPALQQQQHSAPVTAAGEMRPELRTLGRRPQDEQEAVEALGIPEGESGQSMDKYGKYGEVSQTTVQKCLCDAF